MSEEWLKAVLPEPINLLGQRLNPLSLGHVILLNRLGNGFFVEDAEPVLEDLFEAVFICCQNFQEGWDSLADPKLNERIQKWQEQLGAFDHISSAEIFEQYKADGSIKPDFNDTGEGGRVPGSPFLLRIKLILQSKLGYREQEALDKPYGSALWEVFGLSELNGDCKITNAEEAEMLEEHKRINEELAKTKEAV